jgi:hypothetical protein
MKSSALCRHKQLDKETRMDVRDIKKDYPLHLLTFAVILAILLFAAYKNLL